METRDFIKTLCKQKIKTFFFSTLIALKVKWVPRFKEFLTMHKKQDSSTSTSETCKNVYLLAFISSFAFFGACIYVQCFFDVVKNQTSNKKYFTFGFLMFSGGMKWEI